MAKEDILLREEMGRLEIEPTKLKRRRSEENPFYNFYAHRKSCCMKKPAVPCSCTFKKKITSNGIFKRKNNRILKEPVLRILKTCVSVKIEREDCQEIDVPAPETLNTDVLSLCTLVNNCNQLKISNGVNESVAGKHVNDKAKWWKNEMVCPRENREQRHSSQGSCSQQALNPPCDVTIDELASYFETLVHIPKKMSSMAEMMYI